MLRKKNLFKLLLPLFVLAMLSVFISCDGDDCFNNTDNNYQKSQQLLPGAVIDRDTDC